jgi:hypothetical protein
MRGTPFGPARDFIGSPYEEIGLSGLFDTHAADACRIAVLPNGDDSFAARIQTLRKAAAFLTRTFTGGRPAMCSRKPARLT